MGADTMDNTTTIAEPRLLRLPAVMERAGLKRSAVYALVAAGAFPQPVKLSERCVAWVEAEVSEWISARVAARAKAAA
jgi:prophage regulatory protein